MILLQHNELERELDIANKKVKDLTHVLEQRNIDLQSLRMQNIQCSSNAIEKVNLKVFFTWKEENDLVGGKLVIFGK